MKNLNCLLEWVNTLNDKNYESLKSFFHDFDSMSDIMNIDIKSFSDILNDLENPIELNETHYAKLLMILTYSLLNGSNKKFYMESTYKLNRINQSIMAHMLQDTFKYIRSCQLQKFDYKVKTPPRKSRKSGHRYSKNKNNLKFYGKPPSIKITTTFDDQSGALIEMKAQIKNLLAKLKSLQQQYDNVDAEKMDLAYKIEDLTNIICNLREEIKVKTKDLATVHEFYMENVENLQSNLADQNTVKEKLEQRISILEMTESNLKDKIKDINAEYQNSIADYTKQINDIEQKYQTEKSEYKMTLTNLIGESENMRLQNVNLTHDLNELGAIKIDLESQINIMRANKALNEDKLLVKERENCQLNEQIQLITDTNLVLEKELQHIRLNCDKISQTLHLRENVIKNLEIEISQKNEQLNSKTTEFISLQKVSEEKANLLQSSLDEQYLMKEKCVQKIKMLEVSEINLQNTVEKLKTNLCDTTTNLNQKIKTLQDKHDEEIANYNANIVDLTHKSESLTLQNAKLTEEISDLKNDKVKNERQREILKSDKDLAENKLLQKEKENLEAIENIVSLTNAKSLLTKRLDELTFKYEGIEKSLFTKEAILQKLENQLQQNEEQLQEKMEELSNLTDLYGQKVKALEEAYDLQDTLKEQFEQKISGLETSKMHLDQKLKEMTDQYVQSRAQYSEKLESIQDQLRIDEEQLQQKTNELCKLNDLYEEKIKALEKSNLFQATTLKEQYEQNICALERSITHLEEKLREMTAEYDTSTTHYIEKIKLMQDQHQIDEEQLQRKTTELSNLTELYEEKVRALEEANLLQATLKGQFEQKISSLETSKTNLDENIKEMTTKHKISTVQYTEKLTLIQDQHKKDEEQLQQKSNELSSLTELYKEKVIALEKANDLQATLQEQYEQKISALEKSKLNLDDKIKEISAQYNTSIAQYSEKLKLMQDQHEIDEARLQQETNKLSKLTELYEEKAKALENSNDLQATLKEQFEQKISALETSKTNIEEKLKEMAAQLEISTAHYNEKIKSIQDLYEIELTKYDKTVINLTAESESYKVQNMDLISQIDQLKTETSENYTQINALNANKVMVEEKLKVIQQENALLITQIESLTHSKHGLEKYLEEKTSTIDKLTETIKVKDLVISKMAVEPVQGNNEKLIKPILTDNLIANEIHKAQNNLPKSQTRIKTPSMEKMVSPTDMLAYKNFINVSYPTLQYGITKTTQNSDDLIASNINSIIINDKPNTQSTLERPSRKTALNFFIENTPDRFHKPKNRAVTKEAGKNNHITSSQTMSQPNNLNVYQNGHASLMSDDHSYENVSKYKTFNLPFNPNGVQWKPMSDVLDFPEISFYSAKSTLNQSETTTGNVFSRKESNKPSDMLAEINGKDRIAELNRRNTLLAPHLKSTYPLEIQCIEDSSIFEDEQKANQMESLNGNLATPQNARKMDKRQHPNLRYLTPSKFLPSIRKTFHKNFKGFNMRTPSKKL